MHARIRAQSLVCALQQLLGEHDLVAKGEPRAAKIKELLLRGDGGHADGLILERRYQLNLQREELYQLPVLALQ